MEKKFSVLRIIGTIYKVAGVIVAVITLVILLFSVVSPFIGMSTGRMPGGPMSFLPRSGIFEGFFISLMALVYGGVIALTLFALGEGIYLLLALEENTRTTARLLQARQSDEGEAGQ